MRNKFGIKSKRELCIPDTYVVHPYLVICTTDTLRDCAKKGVDFSIFDGGRFLAEQYENVRIGVSQTLDSRHLPTGKCQLVHAVDLVPIVEGKLQWDSKDKTTQKKIDYAFDTISEGMYKSSEVHSIALESLFDLYGWDRPHWQLNHEAHP